MPSLHAHPPLPPQLSLGQAFWVPSGIGAGDDLRELIAAMDQDLAAQPPEQRRSWFLVYRAQIVTAIIQSLIAHDAETPLPTLIAQLCSLAPTLTLDEALTFAGVARMLSEHQREPMRPVSASGYRCSCEHR